MYAYIISSLSIQLSIDTYLCSYFCHCYKAAKNIEVHISFLVSVFVFFVWTSRSGICGSHDSSAFNFFFIFNCKVGHLLYNTVTVFAIHHHESATGTHMFPPSCIPFLPPAPAHLYRLSQSTSFGLPGSCSKPPLAICFMYDNLYVSMLFSHIIPPLFPPLCPKVCPLFLCHLCCPARGISTIILDSMCMH